MTATDSERAQIATVVEGVLAGFSGVDLEDIEITPVGRRSVVRVTVDRDGGIDLDLVAEISSAISGQLDAAPDVLSGAYVLEVSSPGVDRPLTKPRHWRRARNRLVATSLQDGSRVTGRVVSTDDNSALVVDAEGVEHFVPFNEVVSALVQVEFNRAEESNSEGSSSGEEDGEGGF
jgi:ribosome maturation factor RimP